MWGLSICMELDVKIVAFFCNKNKRVTLNE
jgi:hypothetical protein